MSNFFTPASQKPPQKISWQERAPYNGATNTLVVGKYEPTTNDGSTQLGLPKDRRCKVAAFDFVSVQSLKPLCPVLICPQDSTLISTKSGKIFASDAGDWKWWHASVPSTLRKLYAEEG